MTQTQLDQPTIDQETVLNFFKTHRPGSVSTAGVLHTILGIKTGSRSPEYILTKRILDELVDLGKLETIKVPKGRRYQMVGDTVLDVPQGDSLPEDVVVKTSTKKSPSSPTSRKSGSSGRDKGVVSRIRELFNEGKGITTVDEMTTTLTSEGFAAKAPTVKTQVGRLRKRYGLSNSTRRSTGIVHEIRSAFTPKKFNTVTAVVSRLEKRGVEITSMSTVRTQVGRLRREHGLTKPRTDS